MAYEEPPIRALELPHVCYGYRLSRSSRPTRRSRCINDMPQKLLEILKRHQVV